MVFSFVLGCLMYSVNLKENKLIFKYVSKNQLLQELYHVAIVIIIVY